jgi:hypothetical protein
MKLKFTSFIALIKLKLFFDQVGHILDLSFKNESSFKIMKHVVVNRNHLHLNYN